MITPDNMETPVSPALHAPRLRRVPATEFPKYTVLREELLVKLELLTDLVQGQGLQVRQVQGVQRVPPAGDQPQGALRPQQRPHLRRRRRHHTSTATTTAGWTT